MKSLKIKDILGLIDFWKSNNNIKLEDILEMNIYIGDDEELNGIHKSYFCELVIDDENLKELSDGDEKFILIS